MTTTGSGKPVPEGADQSSSGAQEPLSIVSLVFGERGNRARRRAGAAFGLAVALYGGALVVALSVAAGRRPGGAVSARPIGGRLTDPRPIAISPPLPPPPPRSPAVPVGLVRDPGRSRMARTASRIVRSSRPVAPAEAATVITRTADAPIDLTAETFAVGTARAFPGGHTAGQGRGTYPVAGTADLRARAAGGGADGPGNGLLARRGRPVTLAEGTWSCPWPAQADAERIDAQTVVIRVRVGPSGVVEAVELVSDPGAGFGAAAEGCARRTRFAPARDATGVAIAAWSPPVRVHFSR
jgi:protein TonB